MNQSYSAASAYNTASQTVSSLRAVVMLYDAMIKALYNAKTAIQQNRLEDRFKETQKTSKIILGLQANLDFDNGGRMALMLDRFYHTIFRDLQRINLRNSEKLCDGAITALKEVRISWVDLAERDDRGELKAMPAAAKAASPPRPAPLARARRQRARTAPYPETAD